MLKRYRSSTVLSTLILILAAAAAASGLFLTDIYRDNAFVTAVWKGNDAVTLFIAVPLLATSMYFARRGSLRAILIWFGSLDVILYNYAFYLFAAKLNRFFLIYVALFTLPIFALVFGLPKINAVEVKDSFRQKTPVRWIAGYLILVAAGLTTVYLIQFLDFINTGQIPEIVLLTDHPTNVVPALDFSMVIPWLVLGGVWLWQHHPWGYVISSILIVKGMVYMLSLTAASVVPALSGFPESSAEIPLWGTLGLGFIVFGSLLLGNIRRPEKKEANFLKE
jgi:hypothetical protein